MSEPEPEPAAAGDEASTADVFGGFPQHLMNRAEAQEASDAASRGVEAQKVAEAERREREARLRREGAVKDAAAVTTAVAAIEFFKVEHLRRVHAYQALDVAGRKRACAAPAYYYTSVKWHGGAWVLIETFAPCARLALLAHSASNWQPLHLPEDLRCRHCGVC